MLSKTVLNGLDFIEASAYTGLLILYLNRVFFCYKELDRLNMKLYAFFIPIVLLLSIIECNLESFNILEPDWIFTELYDILTYTCLYGCYFYLIFDIYRKKFFKKDTHKNHYLEWSLFILATIALIIREILGIIATTKLETKKSTPLNKAVDVFQILLLTFMILSLTIALVKKDKKINNVYTIIISILIWSAGNLIIYIIETLFKYKSITYSNTANM